MAKRINKYLYLWVVQGYYGDLYKWEDVAASEHFREARDDLKAHRENEPYLFRMIQRRELNPEWEAINGTDLR